MKYLTIMLLLVSLLVLINNITGEAAILQPWQPILPVQHSTNLRIPNSHYKLQRDKPLLHQSQITGHDLIQDQCTLYKITMNQQLKFQYIHYNIDLPDLKEFTLCMWTKFSNNTNDHPLFSYAVGDQPRSILSWIANTPRSSYYMLNIDGHNLYRLNYPLQLHTWYHSCQSWNGRTGEWQIWVNDERVGRGFNNRLVGHVIKGGGMVISGQDQQQLGDGFFESEKTITESNGMLGELTMVQLYKVALTAGKAHRDHKHHHAHHFEHTSNNNMPLALMSQAPMIGSVLSMSPLLTGRQLNHQVKINPGAHIQIMQNGVTLRHPSLSVPSNAPQILPPTIVPIETTIDPNLDILSSSLHSSTRNLPINGYSFIDRHYRNINFGNIKNDEKDNYLQKQDEEKSKNIPEIVETKFITRQNLNDITKLNTVNSENNLMMTWGTENATPLNKKKKRGTQLSNVPTLDDLYIQQLPQILADNEDNNGNYFTGLKDFSIKQVTVTKQDDKTDEREPAEDEVRRIMNICDGCAADPFQKALILSWRNVPKQLYSGAIYIPAIQACNSF